MRKTITILIIILLTASCNNSETPERLINETGIECDNPSDGIYQFKSIDKHELSENIGEFIDENFKDESQIGNQIAIGNEQKKQFDSIKLELLNCLPVPKAGTNFQEILNFKEKRKDELLALHSTIDSLYLDILSSPEPNFKKKKSISGAHLKMSHTKKKHTLAEVENPARRWVY